MNRAGFLLTVEILCNRVAFPKRAHFTWHYFSLLLQLPIDSALTKAHDGVVSEGDAMTQAFALEAAIKTVVSIRAKSSDVTAIWSKLDRVASYLNKQLATELTAW